MRTIKIFYDIETTGTNPKKHSIHQIAGLIEVDGRVEEEFNYFVQPHPKALYDPAALLIANKSEAELKQYPPMQDIHRELIALFGRYLDRFDRTDKAWQVGFNNRAFDDVFLRAWFEQNGDMYIGSWFWSDSLDGMVLASQYLIERRRQMPNFKLHSVARELGIPVDESQLHDGLYDIKLTREIYRVVTGLEIEL